MFCLVFAGKASYSQNKSLAADTSITFKVFGACVQCKDRIENAVKGKGVKTASWDVDSKQLLLVYNPSKIALEKIQNKIVAVGHDLENKKAKNVVYNALPQCCHYREMETMMNEIKNDTLDSQIKGIKTNLDSSFKNAAGINPIVSSHYIKGVVLEEDSKGRFKSLSNASVFWIGTNNGVITDSTGIFTIKHDGINSRLVVSYAGYQSDTITVTEMDELKIVLVGQNRPRRSIVICFSAC